MVHDQLHVRGGPQVSLAHRRCSCYTNIASNVGPQFDPKDIDVVEIQRGGYDADYGERTYGVFNVIPRSGFERNREIELLTTYGNFHSTDSQISIGDHTERFAYYASISANRSDVGLMPPEPNALHDDNNGVSGFTSLIFNATPRDQLRLAASARADFFQVPNTSDQQAAEIRDTQRERDGFVNFSWVHTLQPGILLTVSPFVHWNRADYNGFSPIPSLLPDQPPIPTDHNNSLYRGAQVSLAITRGRHNARFGTYGFGQQDDSVFRVVATDGSGSIASEKDSPAGGLFTLFAEDQFRATDWFTFNAGVRYTHFSAGVVEDKTDPRIGTALRIPKLGWVLRAFSVVVTKRHNSPRFRAVAAVAAERGPHFAAARRQKPTAARVRLTIPVRGWTIISRTSRRTRNFFDHDVLGNSIFSSAIHRTRAHSGWESTLHSPHRRLDLYLIIPISGGRCGVVTVACSPSANSVMAAVLLSRSRPPTSWRRI
jgi:outer membrane receptor protein involved in Fe transport